MAGGVTCGLTVDFSVQHVRYSKIVGTHATTPATRAGILSAARRVLRREGAERLALARVAEEAGLTVGGVRYHFPVKADLVRALADDLVGGFEAELRAAPAEPGARTLAYLDATLRDDYDGDCASVSLLLALAGDPDMMDQARSHYASWQELLADDGIDPAVATAVRLAADGWWLALIGGLAPPAAGAVAAVRAVLVGLVEAAR
jgi:AcrR family transcriptional regulator